MRIVFAAVLAACGSAVVQAEPLNYDYGYLSRQKMHVDGESFSNDTLGAYKELGERLHVFGSYGNAGAYGNPAWKHSRALRIGLGGHWLLGADTMIALEGAVVRARFDRPTGQTVRDTGAVAIVELRHRFAPWVEAIASASRSDVLGRQEHEFVAGPVFHVNSILALGALYRRTGDSSGFDLTLRTYY